MVIYRVKIMDLCMEDTVAKEYIYPIMIDKYLSL